MNRREFLTEAFFGVAKVGIFTGSARGFFAAAAEDTKRIADHYDVGYTTAEEIRTDKLNNVTWAAGLVSVGWFGLEKLDKFLKGRGAPKP